MSFITFNNLSRFEQGIKNILSQVLGGLSSTVGNSTLNTAAQNLTGAINEHEVDIGDMDLETTAEDLTEAINELNGLLATIVPVATNTSYPDHDTDGWKWRRYSDGSVEAWYKGSEVVNINVAVNGIFRSSNIIRAYLPSNVFTTINTINVTGNEGSNNWISRAAYFPTDNYITLWPLSAITQTGVTMTYSLYVQGKKV